LGQKGKEISQPKEAKHWGSALFREGGGASKLLQYQATQALR